MIVLDTSIWIEYFKRNEPYHTEVKTLLQSRTAIAFEPVFGELLQGSKSKKETDLIINYWNYTPKVDSEQLFINAGILSYKEKLLSKGVGIIDSSLIVTTIQNGYKLWTLDKKIINSIVSKYIYKIK